MSTLDRDPAERAPRHNHLTHDVKAPGVCPGCDAYHRREGGRLALDTDPKENP